MSRLVLSNLKSKLESMYNSNIKINIGFYDDNNNIIEEKNIPLGNYLNDPLPSKYEKQITENLTAKYAKA
ncbi:MAG: hypothetical protein VX089_00355 [Pseudomonadota bacterium]|nr:hypothetical protein [Pseudomonadota bacterium]